jgi:muramoyltetrapeptide carboxypeptidase
MELIVPPFLKPGDTIGIVAPARKVEVSDIEPAVAIIKSWGLNVVHGKNLFGSFNQFSGTDIERAADLQDMIDNPKINAILCARGGYGTIKLLDKLNLRSLQRNPKWVAGYSDITVLHSILNTWYLVETIHSTMPINFPKNGEPNTSTNLLRDTLFGINPSYSTPYHSLNREGKAEGFVTGGNLSILCSLSGSDADINTEGKILFIEDLDEYLYHIDRMMMNLKRSGKLKSLAGLVVGGMIDMHDNPTPFGKSPLEIILDAVAEYDFPICFDFPAGHDKKNYPLILGRRALLNVTPTGSTLDFVGPICST